MLDFTLTDLRDFCLVMAFAAWALKTWDQERVLGSKRLFGSEQVIADLDVAHIGFGALAGIAKVFISKQQD